MDQILNVYGLPSTVTPEEMRGGVAVVIDVLRASTTIVHAMEAGAAEIIPCQEIDEARDAAGRFPEAECLLGGEREGLLIEGFDLGNSPTDYTPDRVSGRTIVFTTTNGTRAMAHCRQADRVLVGAFVNAEAVCRELMGQPRIHLLCAGTRGDYSRDDVLLAGLLVDRLQRQGGIAYQMNVQAIAARENWTSSFAVPYALGAEPFDCDLLAKELRTSLGGRNLTAVGLEEDIITAAQLDRFDRVPELDLETFRIRSA